MIDFYEFDEPELCGLKRSKRSKITCEREVNHTGIPMTDHVGRGKRGHWFFWTKDEDEDL